jgi:hypothetical protein
MLEYLYGKKFGSKIAWPLGSGYSYLSAYEDGTECSETLAYKIQKPGNYPEEST